MKVEERTLSVGYRTYSGMEEGFRKESLPKTGKT